MSHLISIFHLNFALRPISDIMKKAYYIILIMLMLQTICITASAKAENQYPQTTLTLNDSTVVTGYLRSNLRDAGSKVAISETGHSKKMSYKIADIHSLEVTYILSGIACQVSTLKALQQFHHRIFRVIHGNIMRGCSIIRSITAVLSRIFGCIYP